MPAVEKLHEECGVFGVWAPERDVARITYFALRALQHRGQESAGIAVGDGRSVLVRKDLGLVTQVFSDADLTAMSGKVACGHCRYGTAGARGWEAAQPHLSTINDVIIALAHNGTLVNFDVLRRELIEMGIPFRSNTDSEVAAKLIGYFTQRSGRLRTGIAHTMRMLEGGYAMVLVRENALYAFRDPHGIRPLVLGRLGDDGWVVASETCALDIAGAKFVREIEPGEIIRVSDDGLRSERGCQPGCRAECIFEHVYFSRPDSMKDGSSFYLMRNNMGRCLAQETPVEADLVISVPDSGTPAAEGFAQELGIPFGTGLIKNRYVARTFIQPTQELRQMGVRLKLNALPDVVRGKRLVMVDDSIVRGTTSRQIVRMLKEAGATEVHVRSASPMVAWPCFYGIDTGSQDQLIAAKMTLEEIRAHIEADSVGFLSIEGLLACVPGGDAHGYCKACFTGEYPVEIPRSYWGDRFLAEYEPKNLAAASETSRMPLKDAKDFLDNDSKGAAPLNRPTRKDQDG
ncbi:MAG TPA: amidophosphoribosyltransferase [Candidatus Olsenella pullicola]|nr:amidophosphoribosyltransferase [Candidatus Olsenella pullicola]